MLFVFRKNKKRREVLSILYKYNSSPQHAVQVSKIAVDIFLQLKNLHRLPLRYAFYLEMASLLHDIGLSVDVKKHHKHSYSLIINQNMNYFSRREQAIIAAVARYHRRALPSDHHEAIKYLSKFDKSLVVKLAAFIRVADGLDRSHNQNVKKIKVKQIFPEIIFNIYGYYDDHDIVAGFKKSDLFTQTFGCTLKIIHI
ncbi:MAG: hypothetical protein DKM50_10625 [Candidatus Margulisiibacteriota bacterium]|nr:MAG: hypothetical protein A2X43_06980 [Candidatus Margulisbacteria bacterium GWD2_39_127]OGI02976.1 MAG: hypothetical protein A2X42_12855 [Candidatus Margulisbacteria bacterium GWF2_38_17]OGI09431.1 MAG: hypothetical protein A2X41_12390 [Candidatus Margulisbacteria bacterium GWE2_39_32]PZM78769.1 MAG: hypothetical protein DKM50_10625 [Candidatus Margulisiibacteriota bacterium]HAR63329.1 hypothetical protein [Candidatus Margulisiibacteriota bacterium]